MFKVLLTTFLLSISVSAQDLFKHENLQYKGLTDHGLKELKSVRDALRQRFRLFDQEFKGLNNIHHAATVARMAKANIFLYGPPGGAKSKFVQWMFDGEADPSFQVQMHQMMTEQVLIGGQNFEAAKEGRYVVNTETSLANYRTALLDEVEKGNPAVLATLLSLLNEREVWVGGQTIPAKTETVYATSNANLPEIFTQFQESGQRSTAPALLNRFQFKGFIYNWLSNYDQAELDERREKIGLCSVLGTCENTPLLLKPDVIDWENLRSFSKVLMKKTTSFMTFYNQMANDLRIATNQAVRESEVRHQKDRYNEPFVYFPSCDWTERLRQQIPDVVQMSAFIDFLLSDLANDKNIEKMITKQIELTGHSLWRASLVVTTPGPGKAALVKKDGKLEIEFGTQLSLDYARDAREVKMLENLVAEQNRFSSIYGKYLALSQEAIKDAAKYLPHSDESNADFELMIMKR
ncbi:MAG: AAA family ATPase [Myxococcota bacterium]